MYLGIYLLSLLILFYSYLSCLIYKILLQNKKNSPIAPVNLTGEKTRLFFFYFFLFSHISRIVSLIILIYLDIKYKSIDYSSLMLFPNFYFYIVLLKTFPTYFFLSSFSIIIVFWSQVYYASILVSFPYLQTLYIFLNVLVYTINVVLASLTYFMKTFYDYIYCNYILEAVIYFLIAIGFIYYGVRVTKKLKEKSKGGRRKSSIVKRILVLSVILFIILTIRGLYSLWCFFRGPNIYNGYLDIPTSDTIIYFISECIPSLLIINTFQPQREKNDVEMQYSTPLCSDTFDPYYVKKKKKKKKKTVVN